MPPRPPKPEPPAPIWPLRRADQAVTAAVAAVGLALLVGNWLVQGRFQGRRIEIDRAAPQQIAFQVDVNSADWPELTLLPEVGEQLAKRIVEYREAHGPFGDLTDLRKVRGVGPKTFDRIRPYLVPMADRSSVAGGTSPAGKDS